ERWLREIGDDVDVYAVYIYSFFFSSRRRHTRLVSDWSSDVCSSDLEEGIVLARGEGNAYDTIQVRHISGGISTLRFRTYSAGRVALQGETLDAVWLDEEPDDPSIYGECLTRVTATGGICVITFTPLKGLTGVALRFLNEPSPDRAYVLMGIDDIPPAKGDAGGADVGPDGVLRHGHIPLAERERIINGYLPHERESRSTGKPALGSGLIYQTPESMIVEDVDP